MWRRWNCSSVLVLVLCSFLLGNDALMAANSHEQQESTVHTHATEVPMVTTCPMPDTAGPATPHLPLPLPHVVNVACVMGALVLPSLDFDFIGWNVPPEYSPDVRRAFLQVFLN